MQKCSHCKLFKEHTSTNAVNKYGISYYCRECSTERMKRYRATSTGKQKMREVVARSIKKHQYKQDARVILNNAVRIGALERPKQCLECKLEKKVEGHHEDYSKPLSVVWLCRQCHSNLK